MPGEVLPYFKNDPVFGFTEYEPPFLFFGDVGALKFTIYCTEDTDFGFEWAVDTQYEVIAIDTFQSLAGIEISITVPITARYGRIFVRNIASVPSDLKTQIFFLSNFSSGDISSVGSGVSLVDNGNIKSLTSVDGSVIITDNITEVDLSVVPRVGLVTVGTVDADYPTVYDAVLDMKCNMRIITDVVETLQLDLSITCPHVRLELVPGVTVSNTIAGGADWFIGNNTLLDIEGSGSTTNFVSGLTSSQIILQNNQSLRSGLNSELIVQSTQLTGSGINSMVGGASKFTNCLFDGGTRHDFDAFNNSLIIKGCVFNVPSRLDSDLGAAKSAIITNNVFENSAEISILGTNSLIFSNNSIGKTIPTNLTISGSVCNNATINNNIFQSGIIIISSPLLSNTHVSNNTFSRVAIDGIVIDSASTKLNMTNNTVDYITLNNTIIESVIKGNILSSNLTITGAMTVLKITNNCIAGGLFLNSLINSVISNNVIGLNLTAVSNTESSIIGNHCTSITLSGAVNDGITSNNIVSGNITFSLDVNDSVVSSNTLNSFLFSGNMDHSRVIGNTQTGTFTVTGTSSDCNYASNSSDGNWNFGGNFSNGMIDGNRMGSSFSILSFNGTVNVSTITNSRVGLVFFGLEVNNSIISSNIASRVIFQLDLNNSKFTDNNLVNPNLPTLTVNGACNGIVISSNTGLNIWRFVGNFNNGSITDNRVSLGAGTGSVVFNGTFNDSTMGNNTIEGSIVVSGVVLSSSISSNTSNLLSLESNVTDTQITGNTLLLTTNSSMVIAGTSNRVVITSNVGNTSWVLTGDFNDGSVSNNRINGFNGGPVGLGTILFGGFFEDSTIGGNTFGNITITGFINQSTISNNTMSFISLLDSAQDTTITGNVLNGGPGNSLTIATTSLRVSITGNTSTSGWVFTNEFLDGSISGNKINAGVNFQNNLTSSAFGNNKIEDSLVINGTLTNCTLDGCRVVGSINIDTTNSGQSTHNTINSNVCGGSITFGSGAGGIVGNIISGNVVPISITTVASNGLNNLVTSNRTPVPGLSGFGGFDIVVANI